MPDQAPNIDIKPGDGGRLVYDKERRTIVAQPATNIETVTTEGDYVIKGSGNDLLRIQFTDESMIITATENRPQKHVIICDVSEAKELRDWLTRRIEEQI